MDKLKLLDQSKYVFQKDGNIWSKLKKRIIKNNVGKDGYLQNNLLCVDGKYRNFKIHRVIAYIYLPNPENKPCIDHVNGNKTDNRIENLRWVTYEENSKNPISKQRLIKSKSKKVYQYTLDGKLINIYDSTLDASNHGFIQTNISSCCIGKRKTHKGYRWSYKPL